MHPFPHLYTVAAHSSPEANVTLSSGRLADLTTASPAEFGGPGDQWSPETLLVGAAGDCFNLTFHAIAKASKFDWISLRTEVQGTLDRPEGKIRFTRLVIRARLVIPPGADAERARRLMQKSEDNCLVTQSLNAEIDFQSEVEVDAPQPA